MVWPEVKHSFVSPTVRFVHDILLHFYTMNASGFESEGQSSKSWWNKISWKQHLSVLAYSSHSAYSASQKIHPPWGFVAIFPKRLRIFRPNFTCLLCVPIYARLRIFIQLSATLTKLCHIKHDHPVHIMCSKCPPSAETHAGIFW